MIICNTQKRTPRGNLKLKRLHDLGTRSDAWQSYHWDKGDNKMAFWYWSALHLHFNGGIEWTNHIMSGGAAVPISTCYHADANRLNYAV